MERVETPSGGELAVGSKIQVSARIRLGPIPPQEVAVELYVGRLDAHGEIVEGVALPMEAAGPAKDGVCMFQTAAVPCSRSGLMGYTVRVLPFHPDEATTFLPGLITWADGKVETGRA